VLGEQFDGSAIGDRVGLGEIPHGFDQGLLAIHVAGVGAALALFAGEIGRNGDRKNFCHSCSTFRDFLQYIVTAQDFQLDFTGMYIAVFKRILRA
jgi:hypothetical protein